MTQELDASGFGTLEFDGGSGVRLAWGNVVKPLRVEYEFFYRSFSADKLEPDNTATTSASGDLTETGFSINLYERIHVWETVVPYWGMGVGAGFADLKRVRAGPSTILEGDGIGMHLQFVTGLEFPIDPSTYLSVELRYVDIGSFTVTNRSTDQEIELSPIATPELGIFTRWEF